MASLIVLLICLSVCLRGFALQSFTNARKNVELADGCQAIVDGCKSALEIKQGDKCVMADELPQYELAASVEGSIINFQSMLEKYYGDISVLENMLSMSEKGHSILVNKMARALDKKKFVVGAIGSSVTAGHDNCHVDAYPSQLKALVSPVFEQAGVNFEARNGGIGGACGDSFVDQTHCLEEIVGDDVDVTHWSWDYFLPDDPVSQEHFIRISLSMPNQPMPMLLTLARHHYPSHEEFAKLYADLGYHSMGASLGTPPEVPEMDADQSFKWKYVGDGHNHRMSRLADKFPQGHCRRNSTGELWRNWHGGPMLYQLISDALSWTYVSALKKALEQHRSGTPTQKPKHIALPDGRESKLVTPPRCISFNRPSVSAAVALVQDQSGALDITEENHRADMLPDTELGEERCEHLDVCGTATTDNGRLTFDLQAKYKTPLIEGILVVCIGGGAPGQQENRALIAHRLQFESIASLPPIAKFPDCAAGSVESIEVDGKKYDVQSGTRWSNMEKCGEFKLDKRESRYVTVQSKCGVTHVFAM
jgi:hypothetical protein